MIMSRLKLPYQAFRSCTCAGNSYPASRGPSISDLSRKIERPLLGGLTRFLTMAEVAEIEDGVVSIDCVAIFL